MTVPLVELYKYIFYVYQFDTHTCIFQFSDCQGSKCIEDQFGFDAIRQLHRSIDDDNDGSLDRSESDEVTDFFFSVQCNRI